MARCHTNKKHNTNEKRSNALMAYKLRNKTRYRTACVSSKEDARTHKRYERTINGFTFMQTMSSKEYAAKLQRELSI